jgi:hypothetical protein
MASIDSADDSQSVDAMEPESIDYEDEGNTEGPEQGSEDYVGFNVEHAKGRGTVQVQSTCDGKTYSLLLEDVLVNMTDDGAEECGCHPALPTQGPHYLQPAQRAAQ